MQRLKLWTYKLSYKRQLVHAENHVFEESVATCNHHGVPVILNTGDTTGLYRNVLRQLQITIILSGTASCKAFNNMLISYSSSRARLELLYEINILISLNVLVVLRCHNTTHSTQCNSAFLTLRLSLGNMRWYKTSLTLSY